jgi:translation initiation factor IF-3
VPVPRRFDRRPPDRDLTRTNDRIRVPEVRLVGEDGKQIGVIKTSEALAYAQERDLDLVEVAPDARPPVCRVLDYSKYKYEQAQKLKAARKHQQQITIREIKFRPKIAQNDYDTKKGHVKRFLMGRDRVKVTIMFRGREVTHPERGTALLEKLASELSEVALVEQHPLQDGRNMTMMLAPSKAVLAGEKDGKAPAADGEAATDAPETPSAAPQAASEASTTASEVPTTASEAYAMASEASAPTETASEEPETASEEPETAPQATEPAPEANEPAPEATEPAPEATEPPPEATEPVKGSGNGRRNGAAETAEPQPAAADAPAPTAGDATA